VLSEKFQVIGHVVPGGGGQIEVVDLIDDDQVGAGLGEHLAHRISDVVGNDVVGVVARLVREPEEMGELARQFAR
jgi:hypothetical protein